MKKLLQFSYSKLLTHKNNWLIAIAFAMATVFTGCKKDFLRHLVMMGILLTERPKVSLCIRVGLYRLPLMQQHQALPFL